MMFFSHAVHFLSIFFLFFEFIRLFCIGLFLFLNNLAVCFSNTAYFCEIMRYNIEKDTEKRMNHESDPINKNKIFP